MQAEDNSVDIFDPEFALDGNRQRAATTANGSNHNWSREIEWNAVKGKCLSSTIRKIILFSAVKTDMDFVEGHGVLVDTTKKVQTAVVFAPFGTKQGGLL
jgi:hypothetical protein